ncbi:MAG: right-handed parallel beta-helix repeat-containing protein, partial [Candidatus Bathyarchaeota archaeon]|nr:right-handed parallel beta-helix repeat-containing protein [Candidatus Bathyarchaeota archaeon]
VHGFGFTDEAFLQAYLIWKNETWLHRMKSDMDTMILREAIIYNGIIAHDTKGQDNANEHWNVAARRTLTLLYTLNQTGFYKNSTYLIQANTLFANATSAHERSKGWQVMVHPSDYSDYAPQNTQVQFSKWLQFVNNTEVTLNTLKDLYRYFGSPTLGNVQGPMPLTWVVDDDGPGDFQTIQEAIDYARIGDTVQVRNGYYYEKLIVQKPLVLVGEDPENTIIDADFIGEVIKVRASNVNISLFTIRKSGVGKPGIYLNSVQHCNIVKNNILDNDYGIYAVFSSNNKIAGNNITFSAKGAILKSSKYNIFHGNRIANSLEVGFSLENGSSNNRFCHNNFVENEEQLRISNSSDNAFDSGYPSGGNFWSDYDKTDIFSGAGQNEDGSDGIGDIPYLLDSEVKDHYPFANYWYSPKVAVLNITMSGSPSLQILTIGRGMTIKIDVAMVNRRPYITACNFTVHAGLTEVEVSHLELKPGESRILAVPMNTSEFGFGNYTIWISTRISTDEVNMIEDTTYGGGIFVTILGDLDGNRAVDVYDIVILSSSYGTDVNDPEYVYNHDLDNTGEIDIFDLVLAATNYGKTW